MSCPAGGIAFARLPDISLDELVAHMTDPRVAEHMPLLKTAWDRQHAARFVAAKEEFWRRDGLGHWVRGRAVPEVPPGNRLTGTTG